MKIVISITIYLFFSVVAFSQTTQRNYTAQNLHSLFDSISITISPGTNNATTISNLETALKSMSGVSYIGYCANHNIFLLTVSASSYATQQLFYSHVKTTTNVTTLLLKEGEQSGILPFCFEPKMDEKMIDPAIEKALLDK
jgi:anthranilate/para-aminobenzoate synthase component II